MLERFSIHSEKRARTLRTYVLLCAGCVMVSTAVVVLEAFTLLALQFCDGEDLMSLYWSTWTMLQVGSLIAMVGIILALLHSLWDSKHPYVTANKTRGHCVTLTPPQQALGACHGNAGSRHCRTASPLPRLHQEGDKADETQAVGPD